MSDPIEPTGQPAGTQPSSTGQPAPTTPPEGFVEMSRLTGALRKIEELTLANRILADTSGQKDVTIGQLNAKVTQYESDKASLVGQHTTALNELTGKYTVAQAELAKKSALELKLNAIKAAGKPELLAIIDSLPVAETPEAQLVIINNMAQFADGIAKKRETELLAGNVDGSTGLGSAPAGKKPTTPEGWDAYINTLPLGSKERKAAFDEYYLALNPPKK